MSRALASLVPACLALSVAVPSRGATLSPTFPDSALSSISIGQKLKIKELQALGFQPVEAVGADESSSGSAALRFEREGSGRTDFVEIGAGDKGVQAIGWTKLLMADAAGETLSRFARAFGFPDDVVAEQGIHAVAWRDKDKSLQLELILQPGEAGSGRQELSAVLKAIQVAPGEER